jgi:hypothetical protein
MAVYQHFYAVYVVGVLGWKLPQSNCGVVVGVLHVGVYGVDSS